jgi:hypothetical protein
MNGYRVIDVPLRERDGRYIEKGVDIRLTTELIAHANDQSYQTRFWQQAMMTTSVPLSTSKTQGGVSS